MRSARSLLKFSYPLVAVITMAVGLVVLTVASGAETPAPTTPGPAAQPAAPPVAQYLGSDACVACHQEVKDLLDKSLHGAALSAAEAGGRGHQCEGCHGPGSLHADDSADAALRASLKATARGGTGCLGCHDQAVSPVRWRGSEHKRAEVVCLDCHGQKGQTHGEVTRKPSSDLCLSCHGGQRAELAMTSHHPVGEDRLRCADCHDSHRRMGREMNRDVCVACHADRRGPFMFEHGALSGDLTDGCLDCHRSHGSPNTRLLKLPSRGVCLQCHADKVNHFVGTVCWDCHQGLHGSNSSPLLFTD